MRLYVAILVWGVAALIVIHDQAEQRHEIHNCYRFTPSDQTCILR